MKHRLAKQAFRLIHPVNIGMIESGDAQIETGLDQLRQFLRAICVFAVQRAPSAPHQAPHTEREKLGPSGWILCLDALKAPWKGPLPDDSFTTNLFSTLDLKPLLNYRLGQ